VIVRMSKIEIAGRKELLLAVLSVIRELGIFHIEPDHRVFLEEGREESVAALVADERVIAERAILEALSGKIDELLSYLPKIPVSEIHINPPAIIDSVSATVDMHLDFCGNLNRKREAQRKELAELERHGILFETLESLFSGLTDTGNLEFIGVTLKKSEAVGHLRELLNKMTAGRFEIFTATARDASPVALLAVQKGFADRIRGLLSEERIPELIFPQSVAKLPFAGKIRYVGQRMGELSSEISAIDAELEDFAGHWLAIYRRVREWLHERQFLLRTTAAVFETSLCFLIYGWVPSADVPRLRGELDARFAGKVVVEEKEIREEDLERVPVAIRNPPYFRSFEIFARLLPLPSYTSFDPTVFIGIFFPIFFGMILGDVAYGLVLSVTAIVVGRVFRGRKLIRDAATVLLVCSIYSILFGLLYGEFLGELGHAQFGLRPLWMSRSAAVIPMLYFAVSVGVAHIMLGLLLGFLSAMRRKVIREAFFKIANILVIICLIGFLAVRVVHIHPHANKVLLIVLGIIIVALVISGGLLAPLELLKSVGNILSYARIMAIGLASVLLASVANRLAGMTGDIITGVLVACLIHTVNIMLGVFSPTIQSLRLHYVEFFSKFLEYGGRKFEPFK
jgi:V/A-type H+-transporting ATPase subunit I